MPITQVSNTLPDDYGLQNAKIERARQLALAMQQQSIAPGDQGSMNGKIYVPPSPLEGVSKIAQAFLANKRLNQADTDQSALQQQMSNERSSTLARALQAREGTPATANWSHEDDIPVPEGQSREITPAAPGNARKFAEILTASKDPMLQQLGMQQLLKEKADPKFSTTPQYDQNGNAYVLSETGDRKLLNGVQARDKPENINGVWVDPYKQKPGDIAPPDPNKPFYTSPNGTPQPNTPYQTYEMGKAKAGATNVNVKTDVKTGESLAGRVGPILEKSADQANAAAQQIDAAQRVIQAAQSGNIISGPMANTRLKLDQISTMFGIGGKDTTERIANTRQAIRGFAELTLKGRQQMKGEGAITEGESKLAEKATSGDIGELTPAEMIQLAKASERVSRFNYAQHQHKLDAVRNNPDLQGVLPFYEAAPINPSSSSGGFKYLGKE